jgi:hypothetical protein
MRVSLSDHERHLSVHIESWRAKNIERRLGVLWSEREREREWMEGGEICVALTVLAEPATSETREWKPSQASWSPRAPWSQPGERRREADRGVRESEMVSEWLLTDLNIDPTVIDILDETIANDSSDEDAEGDL